jgi:hypothetical protein
MLLLSWVRGDLIFFFLYIKNIKKIINVWHELSFGGIKPAFAVTFEAPQSPIPRVASRVVVWHKPPFFFLSCSLSHLY